MTYLSVCSGIEAATVAWHPLGFTANAFAEIDAFPAAVLAHHYPTVPNHGDMTKFKDWPDANLDVLVGGTPCQSFSVAGLRAGLADPRGNLALTYLAVLDRYRPRWMVWENVPGVLSADNGRAMGAFLGGLGELGYGFAYRVLDAQYFRLAQRRQRVFVVGHLGDWRRAAAVLFERASLSGHPAPRRETGEDVTGTLSSRASAGGGLGTDFDVAGGVISIQGAGQRSMGPHMNGCGVSAPGAPMYTINAAEQHAIAAYQCHGSNVGPMGTLRSGNGNECGGVPFTLAIRGRGDSHDLETRQDGLANAVLTPNGGRGGIGVGAVAFDWQSGGDMRGIDPRPLAQLQSEQIPATLNGMQVRRLTPRECERLQGFPDDYTLIPYRGKPAADGPRYKALCNSMAVPVMRWIGRRIAEVAHV